MAAVNEAIAVALLGYCRALLTKGHLGYRVNADGTVSVTPDGPTNVTAQEAVLAPVDAVIQTLSTPPAAPKVVHPKAKPAKK